MKLLSVNPDCPLTTPCSSAITSITTIGSRKKIASSAVGADMNASGRSRERRRLAGEASRGTDADSITAPRR